MKKSRRLVVDASIARAAGGPDAVHPLSKDCRDCLMSIRDICHRIVFESELAAEWKKHRSAFARTWLTSMEARRKVVRIAIPAEDRMSTRIQGLSAQENAIAAMVNDAHLIDAALATDSIVLALDEIVRGLFTVHSATIAQLRQIMWANPGNSVENCTDWMKAGAPVDNGRKLRGKVAESERGESERGS